KRITYSKGIADFGRIIAASHASLSPLQLYGSQLQQTDIPVLSQKDLEDLRTQAASARASGYPDSAIEIEEYIESQTGLRGESRRQGGSARRAKEAIQKRMREALARLKEEFPALAEHLDLHVKRRDEFRYDRPATDEMPWYIQL
ncbi:MAG: hypothetical protein ACYTEZ_20400, partial [Planctomycetota bacterium]